MNYNNLNEIVIKKKSFFMIMFFIYFCMLYAFFEYRVFVSVIFILVFLYYFLTRRKSLSLYTLWNIIFLLWCCLTLEWSYDSDQTFFYIRILLEIYFISNLIIAFVDSKDKLITIYKVLAFSGLILIIRLMFEFPLDSWLNGRLGSTGEFNPNRIGLYLTFSAIAAFYLARMKKINYYYILVIVFTLVIFLTGSRKAFVMLLSGIALLIYLNNRNTARKIASIPIIIIMMLMGYLVVMNVPVLYDILGYRIDFLSGTSIDNSAEVRLNMIEIGKTLFLDRPFLGYGVGTYNSLTQYSSYSHNNYIELLVGIGAFGLIIYYSMVIYIVYKLFRNRRYNIASPLFVIIFLLIFMDYGLVSYYGHVYQFIIALGFAAVKILKRESLNDKKALM